MAPDQRAIDLQVSIPLELLQAHLQAKGLAMISAEKLKLYRSINAATLLFSQVDRTGQSLIAPFLVHSRSQLGQDLFALAVAGDTSPKFFVEFGATDGVRLSNTFLLESELGWTGILAEPAKVWHQQLKANRVSAIDNRCVYSRSGESLAFLEVASQAECKASPELSGLEQFANNGDWASGIRTGFSNRYSVETVSLRDLLDSHDAPGEIQFLSMDVEGGEFEILKAYDFRDRVIRSICVEHNYGQQRAHVHALLVDHGYKRVHAQLSRFDDWYVLNV